MTATALPEAADRFPAGEPRRHLSRRRRGMVAGVVALVGVYLLLRADILPRPLAVLLPLLLVCTIPVAPGLARRVAVNGALLLGCAPLLWMVRWPVHVDHGALVTATGFALVTWRVVGAHYPRVALRALVPSVARVDAMVLVAVVGAFVTVRPWLTTRTARETLWLLIPGYDNAGHFDMYFMLRTHGATIDTLGRAPDGSAWLYDDYPQAFHALLATYADLAAPQVGTPAGELVLYAHAVAGIVMLATAVLIAAVCSLPVLRDRPWVLVPTTLFLTSAFLWEPGARLLANGFANFWFAGLCASTAVVLALGDCVHRSRSVGTVAAVTALVTAVSLTWTPLVVLVGPAVLPFLLLGRDPWAGLSSRSTYRRASVAFIVLMTAGVLKAVAMVVNTISVSEVVEARGQVSGAPFPVVLLLLVISVAAVVRLGAITGDHRPNRRVRWLALTPLGGLAMLTILLVMQLRTLGTSSYYFLKLLVGFELVVAALAAVAVAVVVALMPRRPRGAGLRAAGALLLAAVLTQSLGHVSWTAAPMLHPLLYGSDSKGNALDLSAMAQGILVATHEETGNNPNGLYVAIGPARGFDGVLPAAWHRALAGTFSYRAHEQMALLGGTLSDVEAAVPYVRRVLATDSGTSVLVDAAFVPKLRSSLGPELAPRVVAVSSTPFG